MRATAFLTVATSAVLAAAVPANPKPINNNSFEVSKFSFGCTAGCFYSFDVSVKGTSDHHPAVKKAVKCSGSLDQDTNYVSCGPVSDNQGISAYISKADNVLHLEYSVSFPSEGSSYSYFGDQRVYSATGPNANKQKEAFCVPETRATAIA